MTSKKTETKSKTQVKPRAKKNGAPVNAQPEDMEMSKDLTQYVTTKQAAERLGLLQTSITHLLYSNRLRGIKIGNSWLVHIPSIEKYLKTKAPGGRPPSGTPQLQTDQ